MVTGPIVDAAPSADLVVNLPSLNFSPNFSSYSGYLSASATDKFHYWLTDSQRNPSKDPLILWLNGGPGCSSIGGLIEELGPFKVKDYGATVYANEYSWNLFANVLFLESPSGVGYSFNTNGNVSTNDDDTAEHNYQALVDFLRKFPEYLGRDTYITGESYGGVYLPTLAVKMLQDKTNFPGFKGMAIGNGALNFPHNYDTMIPLYYYHGLVRDEYIFNATNDLDPYNIYSTCYSTVSGNKRDHIERFIRRASRVPARVTTRHVPLCDQIGNTEDYMNRADVRKALHIPSSLPRWIDCSSTVENSYTITHYEMSNEIEQIASAGVRILIYNGDVDTVCSHVMNRQFLSNLNRTIIGKERVNEPWYYLGENPTVAGFQLRYEGGIDFLTVRGSGHFVPEDKPREALQMIYNFVSNRDYSLPTPF
ncbi:unnamed protein product [Nippostrongylus brasiliensis]|uniref:Carboxypeptidase n=1 Tax=Nippostrongylus brasiliensis TaxID=27835 RepID=A0A3P7BMX1_NIPBR|nr:unnamed protein product [Nippostrongylus brasiliensis]